MENNWVPRDVLVKKMKEDIKRTENSVKCDCGHTVFMGRQDKKICSWCGKYVFKDKKEEFKYRMEQMI